ncbi:uncharacterized protein LOC127240953 [Andrographis paniculata]|uniref:uncharacterized protein LOC127240953 n=1 Tax=Andrographis paniculata TaxID=175694 RepID=UPI0021E7E697|nr:uncharacterized protein LOC127240953 [Andrographis paniculata]
MPRTSRTGQLIFDSEIERIARRLRKEAKERKRAEKEVESPGLNLAIQLADTSSSDEGEEHKEVEEVLINPMAQRTLRELAAPDLIQHPLCITFPAIADNTAFELKSGLIHLLPSFHGLAGEEPHKHLQEFDVVCTSMKPPGLTEEQIKLRAFPFSSKDAAKDWLFNLPSGSVITWMDMKRKFLEKFFPASRAANLRKEICGIKQTSGESLYEYWDRFNKLIARCPQHQISEQLLIQYFYEGLTSIDRRIIDAASGGALMNKTPREAWELLNDMAMNSQQFGPRDVVGVKEAIEVSSPMQQQLNELTAFVRKLAVGNAQVKPCGICGSVEHPMDACPTLREEVEVNAAGFAPRRAYDPYSNTYNPGWRDHPNFRYGNQNQQSCGQQQPPGFQPQAQQQQQRTMHQAPVPGNSLHGMVKKIASNVLQFQQETRTSIKNLEAQMCQVVKEVREMKEKEKGKLPAQTHMNPSNVSSMILRSGKELKGSKVITGKERGEEKIEKEIEHEVNKSTDQVNSKPPIQSNANVAPFPHRLAKPAKSDKDKEIMEMFKKVELSIPLLDAIKQVPRYAKFLKELCTKKQKLRGDENVLAGETVSAVLQRKLPQKCGDPGMFVVPCKIGKMEIKRAMLDLGAAINVMPNSIFKSLNIGPLKETGIIIQLADRTNAYPEGIIEDVLVQVNELIFPVDFYVLDMHDDNSPNPSPILLGRPFMCTAQTKIDVKTGTLTMEFEGVKVHFNIFDAMGYPVEPNTLCCVDVLTQNLQEVFDLSGKDELEVALTNCLDMNSMDEFLINGA